MEEFNDLQKRICEHNRYKLDLKEAENRIDEMTEEQVQKVLYLAQNSNQFDTSALSKVDRLVIHQICEREAEERVSKLSETELRSEQQRLWDKHVQHCAARKDNQPLTTYETTLLAVIEDALREIDNDIDKSEVSIGEE